MYKSKILIVEDDSAISHLIRTTLETQDYSYQVAMNGERAMMLLLSYNPDLILLDLGLPDMNGLDIITKVRRFSQVPIIVVSARSEDQDKVEALDAGADDYLTKPFSVEEFLARVRVALRRKQQDGQTGGSAQNIYQNGKLRVDYLSGCAYFGEEELHLTPIEYKLLTVLSKNTGKVLTHNYILKEVWGHTDAGEIPSLRVFMATLRKKIEKNTSEPQYIQTHIGVGYRMIRQENELTDQVDSSESE